MNGYDLSRSFWDFSFENPEKIKPIHSAIFFFAIEHCNRLGWKDKFGFPTTMTMDAIGVKSYNTYIKALNELVDFGFIKMVQRSKNQYSANIIALSNFDKALDKALDKAFTKHRSKQSESTVQSTVQSIDSIDKQVNNKQVNNKQRTKDFDRFWDLYDKKTGKAKTQDKFIKLTEDEVVKVFQTVEAYVKSTPEKKFRKDPLTWLNGRHWEDEISGKQGNSSSGEYEWTWTGADRKRGTKEQYLSDKKNWDQPGFGFKTLKKPSHE